MHHATSSALPSMTGIGRSVGTRASALVFELIDSLSADVSKVRRAGRKVRSRAVVSIYELETWPRTFPSPDQYAINTLALMSRVLPG